MKEQFPKNASELSTFLIHRQSQDKLSQLVEKFSQDAFSEWVSNRMKGDYQEFAIAKATESYFTISSSKKIIKSTNCQKF